MIGHKFDPASSKWRMHIADAYEAAFKKIHPELHLVLECNRNVYKTQTGDMPRA